MSYLESKEKNPKFSEAIISFWFRVPSESLNATKYDNDPDPSPPFNGILPLLVLGEEGREEGKYDFNPTVELWHTYDFQCDGVPMDTHAESVRNECVDYDDFTFFGTFFHCCKHSIEETMYTATPSTTELCEPSHHEEYRVVYHPTPHEKQKANPTCIGVDADGYLYVNFQTNTTPDIGGEGWFQVTTNIKAGETYYTSGNQGYREGMEVRNVYFAGGFLGCVGLVDHVDVTGPTVVPGVSSTGHIVVPEETTTKFYPLAPETGKYSSGGYEETGFGNAIEVSPDRWHHVLVSVKLRTTKTHSEDFVSGQSPRGFEGGSLLYVALDDKNYIKNDLNGMWDWGTDWRGGGANKIGDNEVYPYMAWDIATDTVDTSQWPQETYSLTNPQVPAGLIGLPATKPYVDNIKRVEMAELQIWFGKSFDTKEEKNRRLFIDSEGKPVKIESKKAEEALGKPDILLHGSSKWKKGINTGKLAPASDSGPPDPWFNPTPETDGIVRWKPDPSLHGPQNPGENPAAPQGGA